MGWRRRLSRRGPQLRDGTATIRGIPAEIPQLRDRGRQGGDFWTGCTGLTGWEGARVPIGCREFNAEAEEEKMCAARGNFRGLLCRDAERSGPKYMPCAPRSPVALTPPIGSYLTDCTNPLGIRVEELRRLRSTLQAAARYWL